MRHVKSIAIVGGGSSGWMSAAYLSSVLVDTKITLIESPRVPKIGVGEATTPALNRFMARLGVDDYCDWLGKADGTIKTGILFRDWSKRGDSYWHPFEDLEYLDTHNHMGHYWLHQFQNQAKGFEERASFFKDFYVTTKLNAEGHRGPVVPSFAFNFDADRFGDYLRTRAIGVRHLRDDVIEVSLDDNQAINKLRTREHGDIEADLYLDCTGFQRLLIRKVAPEQPFESYRDSLFCDRAVVLRFPYASDGYGRVEMHPYVQARAMNHGWVWSIPLHSRLSSGYVYSSGFADAETAERELRAYWGEARTKDVTAHHIRFESGKLKNLWAKNCVAIGLAGSFVEPLESTGLAITQVGLEILASTLDARYFDESIQSRYNMHMQKFCDDIRQFIIAHYCFTQREDTPFWRAVKWDTVIPADLAARLDVFRRLLPSTHTKGMDEWWFFRDVSWFSVLLGMHFDFAPSSLTPSLLAAGERVRLQRIHRRQQLLRTAPSHIDFLREKIYNREFGKIPV
jgi:tryptophan 6-halogenase